MKKIFLLLLLSMGLMVFAQRNTFLKYPKITKAELQSEASKIDPDAPAEVLYRSVHHYFDDTDGTLKTDVYTQIKVYDKDRAEDYLTVEVKLYEPSKTAKVEEIGKLKATTYNLVDGKIQTDVVEKDSKFKSRESKDFTFSKFTFPNVKNGSVLEYSYRKVSPFFWLVPSMIIEQPIPVAYVEFVFDSPQAFGYNLDYTGNLQPSNRYVGEENMYGYPSRTYRFGYTNIKPYGEEDFVLNSENYKTKIAAELNSVSNRNGSITNYARSWDDIQKQLKDDADFGGELRKKLPKGLIPDQILAENNPIEKAKKILALAQTLFKWNGSQGFMPENGTNKLVTNKTGNVGDINITLVKMFREAGLDANPALLSTVGNGQIGVFPSMLGLNYVIAAAEIDGKTYLFDASNKQSRMDVMPPKVYNKRAFLYTDTGMKPFLIENLNQSTTVNKIVASLNTDGTVTGTVSDHDDNLFSMLDAEDYEQDKEDFDKRYKKRYKFAINDLHSGLQQNNIFESKFSFEADNLVDHVGSRLILNPLLFLYNAKNPFSQTDERTSPIEFITGYTRVKEVSLTIPEGYEITNLPKSKKIKTDDDEIAFRYEVHQEGNTVNVRSSMTIASSDYPQEYYPAFKQIYDFIVKQEGQLITVQKVN